MSYDCLKMRQEIRSLGKRLQKDPTNTFLRHTYSIHVKHYNRLKKSLKSAFYKTFIDKMNTLDHKERKSFWNSINSLKTTIINLLVLYPWRNVFIKYKFRGKYPF